MALLTVEPCIVQIYIRARRGMMLHSLLWLLLSSVVYGFYFHPTKLLHPSHNTREQTDTSISDLAWTSSLCTVLQQESFHFLKSYSFVNTLSFTGLIRERSKGYCKNILQPPPPGPAFAAWFLCSSFQPPCYLPQNKNFSFFLLVN